MKKINLRRTWELCLAMWKWISENWDGNVMSISRLKREWLTQNGFFQISERCFFCHYDRTHAKTQWSGREWCEGCPGGEVAPRFDCFRSGWNTDPPKFYRTLKRMYAKKKKLAGWK